MPNHLDPSARSVVRPGTDFWDDGYLVLDDLLSPSDLSLVATSMDYSRRETPMMERADGYVFDAHDEYSPVAGEMLLRRCRPVFEDAIGRQLVDTYAYWRIYRHGGLLRPHVDRASCEISATLPIRCEPAHEIWPIEIEDLEATHRSIRLAPGSALLYQGHRIKHWREPFCGAAQLQLMFHYVLKDGALADRAFDDRECDPLTRRKVT